MATAWAVPRTWVTAEVVTSGEMNTDVRDNITWLGTDRPMCRVYANPDFPVPNNAATAVTFDSERYDNQGMHSTVTNTDRVTVPTGMAGKYLFGGHLKWTANTTGEDRILAIILNGTLTLCLDSKNPGSVAGNARHSITTMYQLAAGDYLQLVAQQNSGGSLNALGNNTAGSATCELWATWMAN